MSKDNLIFGLPKEEFADKFEKYIADKIKADTIMMSRISNLIKGASAEQFNDFVTKFIKWEVDFEDRKYREGIQTSSTFFSAIIKYCTENAESNIDSDDDFFSSGFIFKEYTFKLYCGQGCFWRIFKDDKIIFQNT